MWARRITESSSKQASFLWSDQLCLDNRFNINRVSTAHEVLERFGLDVLSTRNQCQHCMMDVHSKNVLGNPRLQHPYFILKIGKTRGTSV